MNLFSPLPETMEVRGPDYFIPAHPAPLERRPNFPSFLRNARHSLLAVWTRSDYRSSCGGTKILGRQVVLCNSPETVKYVLATRNDNFERKSPQMRRALEYLLGDGLFISDGATWKQRRPLVADIVHKNRMPQFGPVMETITGDMLERWDRLADGTRVNLLAEMATLTAEIIAKAVFGNQLTVNDARDVIEGFTDFQHRVDSINIAYFVGVDEGLPLLRGPRLARAVRRVHGVIDRVVTEHIEGRGDHNSMLDLLVRRQQRNPDSGLDKDALRNEAATIFMAGHETTAATLTWAWYCLARAPWIERAVHEELARVVGPRRPVLDDVPKLDMCRAVIEETLRLYPPVAILARQARDGDRIGTVDIKPAALALVVPWLLHRSPDLWDRPNHFLPERFLQPERPQAYSYIPFAIGPRICAGLTFGLSEAILCLAIIAQRYRVVVADDEVVDPACRLTVRPRNGLPATIQRRA